MSVNAEHQDAWDALFQYNQDRKDKPDLPSVSVGKFSAEEGYELSVKYDSNSAAVVVKCETAEEVIDSLNQLRTDPN